MFGSPGGRSRRPALRRDSPGRRLPPGASSSPLQVSQQPWAARSKGLSERQGPTGVRLTDHAPLSRCRPLLAGAATRSCRAFLASKYLHGTTTAGGVQPSSIVVWHSAKFDCCLTLVTLLCRTMTSSEREAGKKSSSWPDSVTCEPLDLNIRSTCSSNTINHHTHTHTG